MKQDIVVDSQLPKGMSGEKLKELERGHIPDEKPEEKLPAEPPRFITQVGFLFKTWHSYNMMFLSIYYLLCLTVFLLSFINRLFNRGMFFSVDRVGGSRRGRAGPLRVSRRAQEGP